ncbi:MAG: UDP-glucose/GDP-mannose dehydrogenase family protein [bacterium]
MDIAVIGAGYVGLVTGAVFAELGNNVVCADKVDEKISMLGRGEMPFYEPGMEELVRRNVEEGRLSFTTDAVEAIRKSEIVFIAVGTPPKEEGETDLSQVEEAATLIGKNLNSYKIVVNKSTVPVGTGDFVKEVIDRHRDPKIECDVVSNPEFLSEGTAIQDAMSPERIVIGAPNKRIAMKLIELYSALEKPMVITSVRSAEMIKYASNAFLATKVSFVNSVANLCEEVGGDIEEVVRGVGLDSRIGGKFLRAGIGFGGSCFPKDTESLLYVARKFGEDFSILDGTININKKQPLLFIEKVEKALGGVGGKTIGVLGLSFKPGTDDLRESTAILIIKKLLEKGAVVRAYDPMAMEKTKAIFPDITYCDDAYPVAEGADALLVVTEWNKFRQLNFNQIKSLMRGKHVFDGRNLYDPQVVERSGLVYHGIGRGRE